MVYSCGSQPLHLRGPLKCHQDHTRATSYSNSNKQMNKHTVAEQRVPAPSLYIIMTEYGGQLETEEGFSRRVLIKPTQMNNITN